MILTQQIIIREKGKPITIPKGAKVEIISWRGEVAICEYQKSRFSVRKEKLQ